MLLRDMDIDSIPDTTTKLVEATDSRMNVIRAELERFVATNITKNFNSETDAQVYPISLFIKGCGDNQIQYARKGGIRYLFVQYKGREFLNTCEEFLSQCGFTEIHRKYPQKGEYTVDNALVIASFGDDYNLASEVISESLMLFGFDENQAIQFKQVGQGCFIATAAYGTPFADEINVLRSWRDNSLLTHPTGSFIVKTYYQFSPPIAKAIQGRESLKLAVRACLKPIIWLLEQTH
jgi:hypothetical protein